MGKNIVIYLVAFILAVIILPAILVKSCKGPTFPEHIKEYDQGLLKINVYFHKDNEIKEMYLEEYLLGVVAGEMPASFDIEALKAQAVIARTYAVSRMRQFGGNGYGGFPQADISTDYAENQHYVTEEEAKASWSFWQRNSNWAKIMEAVYLTMGEIINYEGHTVDALYHSTCGGATEDSEDVFTNPIPYLRGKDCPYCKESTRYTSKVTYTKSQLAHILEQEGLQHVIGATSIDMQAVTKTSTDRIIQYRIGEKLYKGTDVRMLFKLNSPRFTHEYDGSNIVFNVVGYGHGVGLCQYGANGMASSGNTYRDIIKFYYTGIEIKNILE